MTSRACTSLCTPTCTTSPPSLAPTQRTGPPTRTPRTRSYPTQYPSRRTTQNAFDPATATIPATEDGGMPTASSAPRPSLSPLSTRRSRQTSPTSTSSTSTPSPSYCFPSDSAHASAFNPGFFTYVTTTTSQAPLTPPTTTPTYPSSATTACRIRQPDAAYHAPIRYLFCPPFHTCTDPDVTSTSTDDDGSSADADDGADETDADFRDAVIVTDVPGASSHTEATRPPRSPPSPSPSSPPRSEDDPGPRSPGGDRDRPGNLYA